MTRGDGDRDHLDEMLEIWAREIPDLDPLTEGVVERLEVLAKDFNESLDETVKATGLDRRGYTLLGRLRSFGAPYRRSAGQLADDMHVSSGAMTARLDRLERAGIIRRLPDPTDRRGTLVEPTELGHRMWDEAVAIQARREALLSSVLTDDEKRQLHDLLRKLMRAFPDKWPAGAAKSGREESRRAE